MKSSVSNDEQPVLLATYENPMEAEIVKARLAASGILCLLQDYGSAFLQPFYNQEQHGIKLFVLEKDILLAKQVLESGPDDSVSSSATDKEY